MIKKLFALVLLASLFSFDSYAKFYVSCCGKPFTGPEEGYFDSEKDENDFRDEMDLILCGKRCNGNEEGPNHGQEM